MAESRADAAADLPHSGKKTSSGDKKSSHSKTSMLGRLTNFFTRGRGGHDARSGGSSSGGSKKHGGSSVASSRGQPVVVLKAKSMNDLSFPSLDGWRHVDSQPELDNIDGSPLPQGVAGAVSSTKSTGDVAFGLHGVDTAVTAVTVAAPVNDKSWSARPDSTRQALSQSMDALSSDTPVAGSVGTSGSLPSAGNVLLSSVSFRVAGSEEQRKSLRSRQQRRPPSSSEEDDGLPWSPVGSLPSTPPTVLLYGGSAGGGRLAPTSSKSYMFASDSMLASARNSDSGLLSGRSSDTEEEFFRDPWRVVQTSGSRKNMSSDSDSDAEVLDLDCVSKTDALANPGARHRQLLKTKSRRPSAAHVMPKVEEKNVLELASNFGEGVSSAGTTAGTPAVAPLPTAATAVGPSEAGGLAAATAAHRRLVTAHSVPLSESDLVAAGVATSTRSRVRSTSDVAADPGSAAAAAVTAAPTQEGGSERTLLATTRSAADSGTTSGESPQAQVRAARGSQVDGSVAGNEAALASAGEEHASAEHAPGAHEARLLTSGANGIVPHKEASSTGDGHQQGVAPAVQDVAPEAAAAPAAAVPRKPSSLGQLTATVTRTSGGSTAEICAAGKPSAIPADDGVAAAAAVDAGHHNVTFAAPHAGNAAPMSLRHVSDRQPARTVFAKSAESLHVPGKPEPLISKQQQQQRGPPSTGAEAPPIASAVSEHRAPSSRLAPAASSHPASEVKADGPTGGESAAAPPPTAAVSGVDSTEQQPTGAAALARYRQMFGSKLPTSTANATETPAAANRGSSVSGATRTGSYSSQPADATPSPAVAALHRTAEAAEVAGAATRPSPASPATQAALATGAAAQATPAKPPKPAVRLPVKPRSGATTAATTPLAAAAAAVHQSSTAVQRPTTAQSAAPATQLAKTGSSGGAEAASPVSTSRDASGQVSIKEDARPAESPEHVPPNGRDAVPHPAPETKVSIAATPFRQGSQLRPVSQRRSVIKPDSAPDSAAGHQLLRVDGVNHEGGEAALEQLLPHKQATAFVERSGIPVQPTAMSLGAAGTDTAAADGEAAGVAAATASRAAPVEYKRQSVRQLVSQRSPYSSTTSSATTPGSKVAGPQLQEQHVTEVSLTSGSSYAAWDDGRAFGSAERGAHHSSAATSGAPPGGSSVTTSGVPGDSTMPAAAAEAVRSQLAAVTEVNSPARPTPIQRRASASSPAEPGVAVSTPASALPRLVGRVGSVTQSRGLPAARGWPGAAAAPPTSTGAAPASPATASSGVLALPHAAPAGAGVTLTTPTAKVAAMSKIPSAVTAAAGHEAAAPVAAASGSGHGGVSRVQVAKGAVADQLPGHQGQLTVASAAAPSAGSTAPAAVEKAASVKDRLRMFQQ